MPIINVKVIENVLSADQKQAVAEGITDAFVAVAGEPARPVTWVVIEDVTSGQWTMGGQLVTTEAVQDMLRQAPAASR